MDSSFETAKYRPLFTAVKHDSSASHYEHQFEYNNQAFTVKIRNGQRRYESGDAESVQDSFEEIGDALIHLMFPMVQQVLQRVLPHSRSIGAHSIQVISPECRWNWTMEATPKPSVENVFPGVAVYKPQEITVVEAFNQTFHQVCVRGMKQPCFQKVVTLHRKWSFSREISTLLKIRYHANVIQLCGVVEEETERICAILLSFKATCALSDVETANEWLKRKWKQQIEHAVQHIHQSGATWGDVNASNVLVDDDNNVCLVNFGGGFTKGWVDKELCGSKEGDKQGCQKLYEMIEDLPEE